ncbi:LytR/AlgR family response regulator transcription factor [Salegentibacter salegens]|uniref:Two component transcriptional regulator, LytTR family n=1 Tax=Salegentibacter salegens TaxID=143223 RepID=A0A1M7HPB3_9FLAO|nr:response regulator transcription factor [Salegentibacter salegens]PRX39914.1 LytTR family two component transcriptional regulator [Salegentibacter salegens]SHM30346.1 two component transcriptional regulator, LytTR family [Salegentibacter salegens]
MSIRCVIIDDEPLAVNVIKNHLSQIKDVKIQASFHNAVEALEFLRDNSSDVIFLDIDMPILDGFSFLNTLERKPAVIITTAHQEYAVKGYELDVLDYLVKPISFPRFLKAIDKIKRLQFNQSNDKEHLFVKVDKKKMKKIYLDDILVVESLKDYIKIITHSGKYIVHQTLSSFTDSLPKNKFLRIHRSYTIAIEKVDAVEGNSVEINGSLYVIGRSYLTEVKGKILDLE